MENKNMDETLKIAYTKAIQSMTGQLDAIFTLQAQNEIQAAKIVELEKLLEEKKNNNK